MRDTRHHNPYVLHRKLTNIRGAPRLLIGAGLVLLGVGPVVGVLGTPSAAGGLTARRAHTTASDAVTQGFSVKNWSNQTLVYDGYQSTDGGELEDGGPAKGTSLPAYSGASIHFEQVYKFEANTSVELDFATRPDDGTIELETEVDAGDTFIPSGINGYLGVLINLNATEFSVFGGKHPSRS